MARGHGNAGPTLGERVTYAVIGFLSGGLLCALVIDPLCLFYIRSVRDSLAGWWLLLAFPPFLFGVLAAIWGFIATDGMVDTLSGWWEEVMDRISRR